MVRAMTFAGYEQTHPLRIAPPPLGVTRISALNVAHCQTWRARMAKDGVSASEQGKAIRLLKRALEQAFAWEMIPKNPAAHLRAPRYRPKETAYARAEDVGRYLAAVRGDPFEALLGES
jgi:site-specific recombinase XerD